jgi:predicted TIM-barrel fold metal-dependent hydrolase
MNRPITAIDCHAHVMLRDHPLSPERHSKPPRDVTVDEHLATMDAHGISHSVLTAPSFYGADNRVLLDALAACPQRLRGTVIVEPDIDDESLAAMDRRGVVGIRLNWLRREQLPDVDSANYRRLFDRVRNLDWHIEIYLEGPKLGGVLPRLRASGAKVVVDHFASPDPAAGVADVGFRAALAGVRAGDTWVKLSAPYRQGGADPQRYVDALLDAGGPQRLMWASDRPWVTYEQLKITYRQCINWLHDWVPDPATRRTILVDTPALLFRFDREMPVAAQARAAAPRS